MSTYFEYEQLLWSWPLIVIMGTYFEYGHLFWIWTLVPSMGFNSENER